MLDMLEIHEDKYLELFLMKCGFSGVQHKQYETDFYFFFFNLESVWIFYFIFIFTPAYILARRQLLIKNGKQSNLK